MSETEKIKAETRTEFGKGAARRIRRDNKVPAVVYGHGNDPIHVTLPGHATMMALKHGGANALLELDIEGTAPARADQAGAGRPDPPRARAHRLRRRPQGREGHRRHPRARGRRRRPRHPGRQRELDRPGRGRGHQHPRASSRSASRACPRAPRSSPRSSTFPAGTTLLVDGDTLVVNITEQISAEALEAELEEAEAEAGIERDESDAEAAEAAAEGDAAAEEAPASEE